MTLGRRFELLTANAAHEIPSQRRQELLEEVANWLESPDCTARDAQELFFMLAAGTAIHMGAYAEQVQANIGAEIIEREMKEL
jgi:hypothetical protein